VSYRMLLLLLLLSMTHLRLLGMQLLSQLLVRV
jgi:hypothetical protein